ncbi:MAG: 23S rRNA (guanosine(2251)-2'-O)-methyltransferase RlmB [Thermogemmatispora sp.]|uniref:23S rRNA (guanosine(2251)-2'-O)-methyltransferase RlmB n=1 Tax=Thermogemmatispora sp. TaxID=1968838 RepID=UPI00260586ED|nr:23S rRNA (guanosine(2251)-2'-O)-methyltransferase RlmB [Thermogemmatispora sp.]MBX5456388.1 23S rRNA (guanosine(2251)-2'-O)-methyltransferase RlmB [Thermogemmatispora sp.]
MPDYVWGRNPVLETLRSSRRVKRLLLAEGLREAPALRAIVEEAQRRSIPIESVPRPRLDQLSSGAVHQGCIAVVESRRYASLDEILACAAERQEDPFVLILDALQDVTNLGSLLRSAEAAGVHGVVIPEHRAAEITPAVVKTSAGATEHLLIARETNLTRCIEFLKQRNIWVIGLDATARQRYTEVDLTGPLALVVGSEAKGLHRLVREHCDLLVSIPMRGRIQSLNAAVAGSIVLYEVLRQQEQRKRLKP